MENKFAMSSSLTPDQTNFFANFARIGFATQDILPEMMQEFIAFKMPPEGLRIAVQSSKFLSKITAEDSRRIRDVHVKGYATFDFVLIYKLLRHLKLITPPTRGWKGHIHPTPTEITIGDDIERLRRLLSAILHRGNAKITDAEFVTYFAILKAVARRMEMYLNKPAGYFVEKLIILESCSVKCVDQIQYAIDEDVVKERHSDERVPATEDIVNKTPHNVTVEEKSQNFNSSIHRVLLRSMDTSGDFTVLVTKGTFHGYHNRIYLAGACNVGKSTLASILIGDEVPLSWKSTNGLRIFFCQNGINLETREMIPLKKNSGNQEILNSLLQGKPEIEPTNASPTMMIKSERQKTVEIEHDPEIDMKVPVCSSCKREITKKTTDNYAKGEYKSDFVIPETVVSTTINQQGTHHVITQTYEKLHDDIKEEIRRGEYRVRIARSDLVDFGGQKSFDMTHQLFILQKGVFVLMLDGRKKLHDILDEYPDGDITTCSILLHWVNSILAYCRNQDDDILPMILFAATHSDSFSKEELKQRKMQLQSELTDLFSKHKHHQRILYTTLFFINGTDANDSGVNALKEKLVDVAFQQKNWGQKLPIAWVPLEIQMSEMRTDNVFIISVKEMYEINENNEDLAMTKEQLNDFLRYQHSIGRIMYFDTNILQKFIIVRPTIMVNILTSIITDEVFWPSDPDLSCILRTSCRRGRISRGDIYKLWSQDEFNQLMPTDELKEFVLQVLIHLDILVEQKRYISTETELRECDTYLVPCLVKHGLPDLDLQCYPKNNKSICLSYRLLHADVPSSLSFKLIGALLDIWPIKETQKGTCLFYNAAILSIDATNELFISINDNRIMLHLTNTESQDIISPDIASVVQECVSNTLDYVMKFYLSWGDNTGGFDRTELFETEVGEMCNGKECLISLTEAKQKVEWECQHKMIHKTSIPLYWIYDKNQKECPHGCTGLSVQGLEECPTDKHLVRLGQLIDLHKFQNFVIKLGLDVAEWNSIGYSKSDSFYTITKFEALCKCKQKKESNLEKLMFKDLLNALIAIEYDEHHLCKIFRENARLHEIATSKLQESPEDDILVQLSRKVGNCAIHLGVELELESTMIENIIYGNSKNIYDQTRAVLFEWKKTCKTNTIHFLMKALQRADPRGLTFLINRYS